MPVTLTYWYLTNFRLIPALYAKIPDLYSKIPIFTPISLFLDSTVPATYVGGSP